MAAFHHTSFKGRRMPLTPTRSFPSAVPTLSVLLLAAGLLATACPTPALAQPAAPTYQGVLSGPDGRAVDGVYDLRLSLFTAATGGSPLQTITAPAVTVTAGRFVTPLGFTTANLAVATHLGVDVRPAGGGAFTPLLPRQPLTPAPSALALQGATPTPLPTLDVNTTSDGRLGNAQTISGMRWQSFTAGVTGRLTGLVVVLDNPATTTRSVTAVLSTGVGTSGETLGSTTLSVPPTRGADRIVLNLQPAELVQGQTYSLRLIGQTPLTWAISAVDVDPGGRSSFSVGQDFLLETQVLAANAPTGFVFSQPVALGEYQGGIPGSRVTTASKQLVLGGQYNTPPNSGSAVKLLISDYDNDPGSDVYPIYLEDENNVIDFFVRKNGLSDDDRSSAYFGGNVGLGVLNPIAPLDVASNGLGAPDWQVLLRNTANPNAAFATGGIRQTNDGFLEISNNASLGASSTFARLSSTGQWTAVSDQRIKSDIATADPDNLLAAALALRPVHYRFIAEKNDPAPLPHLGLIAQELRAILPDLVTESDDLLTVNYANLSVVALGAIQAQQREIQSLRDQLATERQAAEQRLKSLEARLAELDQRLGK